MKFETADRALNRLVCRATALDDAELACDVLLAREDVKITKPHPAHLLDALRVLQVKFPERRLQAEDCLMVGDNVMDVQAGRAAKMRTVGLLRNQSAEAFTECPPDILLKDIAELWSILNL